MPPAVAEQPALVVDPTPYRGLVWSIARARAARCPARDLQDIAAAGMVGLVQAAQTFDPGYGVQFRTHARWQILAAIKVHMGSEHRNRGWTRKGSGGVRRWRRAVKVTRAPETGGMDDLPRHDDLEPDEPPSIPPELLERMRAVLSERQRQVIDGIYLRGLSGPKVAAELGITRSRVGQIKLRALEVLRDRVRLPCEP